MTRLLRLCGRRRRAARPPVLLLLPHSVPSNVQRHAQRLSERRPQKPSQGTSQTVCACVTLLILPSTHLKNSWRCRGVRAARKAFRFSSEEFSNLLRTCAASPARAQLVRQHWDATVNEGSATCERSVARRANLRGGSTVTG